MLIIGSAIIFIKVETKLKVRLKFYTSPHNANSNQMMQKCGKISPILQGNREVTTQEARDFAAYHGIGFAETSAKTGQNVEEAFQMVTQQGRYSI